MERILGIDPGFGRVGYGVIEKTTKNDWKAVAYGCIETPISDPFVDRLAEMRKKLVEIIKKYSPSRMAVEDLFFFQKFKNSY